MVIGTEERCHDADFNSGGLVCWIFAALALAGLVVGCTIQGVADGKKKADQEITDTVRLEHLREPMQYSSVVENATIWEKVK